MSFNRKRAKKSLARKRHSSGGHESIRGRGNGKSYPIRSIRIPYEDSPLLNHILEVFIVAIIGFSVFFLAVPVWPAQVGCPNYSPGGRCFVDYQHSLSCVVFGVNGIGDYYFQGSVSFSCEPILA